MIMKAVLIRLTIPLLSQLALSACYMPNSLSIKEASTPLISVQAIKPISEKSSVGLSASMVTAKSSASLQPQIETETETVYQSYQYRGQSIQGQPGISTKATQTLIKAEVYYSLLDRNKFKIELFGGPSYQDIQIVLSSNGDELLVSGDKLGLSFGTEFQYKLHPRISLNFSESLELGGLLSNGRAIYVNSSLTKHLNLILGYHKRTIRYDSGFGFTLNWKSILTCPVAECDTEPSIHDTETEIRVVTRGPKLSLIFLF